MLPTVSRAPILFHDTHRAHRNERSCLEVNLSYFPILGFRCMVLFFNSVPCLVVSCFLDFCLFDIYSGYYGLS